MNHIFISSKKYALELFFFGLIFIFSLWLMFSTFSYDPKTHELLIASREWSDFASHIPLIRSFSLGNNFPPEYPLFPNLPIKYHFLFYLLVALLEKIGIRIDIALNVLSSLSFFFLCVMIFLLAKKLFKKTSVGILAILFFLFNGSLSFLEFFATHSLSSNIFNSIVSNTTFPSFGPYDGKIVSAFWNLNIYTNQRHLAFSFGLALFVIYFSYKKIYTLKSIIVIFFLLVILLITNQAAFVISLLFLGWFFLEKIKHNYLLMLPLVISFIISVLYSWYSNLQFSISYKLGFLMSSPITPFSFVNYWIHNLGIQSILIPFSFLKTSKSLIKSFLPPILVLFILPNIIQFSPDIINNHKFFNFFLIICNIFVAHLLVILWEQKTKLLLIRRFIISITIVLLTLSGIIDFFVIKNDYFLRLSDVPVNKNSIFLIMHTKSDDIILTSTRLYNFASLAGRPIFMGYSYFPWSYGYDTASREKTIMEIYNGNDFKKTCNLLQKNHISYVETSASPDHPIHINYVFWNDRFKVVYKNPTNQVVLYDVKKSCK